MLTDTFAGTPDDNDIYQELETLLDNEGFTAPLRESLIQVAEINNAPELIAFLSKKEALELLGPHSVLEQNYDLYRILNKFFFIALFSRQKENIDHVLNLNPLLTRTYQIEFFHWHLSTFTPMQPDVEIENDFNPNDMSWLLTNENEPDDALLSSLYEELLNDRTELELEATESMLTLPVRVKSSWQEKLITRILLSNSRIAKQRFLSTYQRGDILTNPIATYLHHAKTDFKKQISAVYHIACSNFKPAFTLLFKPVSPNQPSLFEEWINAEGACHRSHFIRAVLASHNIKAIQILVDKKLIEAFIRASAVGSPDWMKAISAILVSECAEAIKTIVNYLRAFIAAAESSSELNKAIRTILSSRNPDAIQTLVDENNKYLAAFIATTEEESIERYESIHAIILSRNNKANKFIYEKTYFHWWLTQPSLNWKEKINQAISTQSSLIIQSVAETKAIWPANDMISENFEASYFTYLLLIAPEKTETKLKPRYIKVAYKEMVLKELKEICDKYKHSFSLHYPAAVSYLESGGPSALLAKRVRETETTPSAKKRKLDKTKNCLDLLNKFRDEAATNFSPDALIRIYKFSTSAEKETKLLIKEINKIKKELGLKNIRIAKTPKQRQYKLVAEVATEYDRLIEHFTTLLTNTHKTAAPEITAEPVTSTQVEQPLITSANVSGAVVSSNNNLITPPQNQDVIMSDASTILPTLHSSSINHNGLLQSSHPLGIIATRGFFGPKNVDHALHPQSNQSAQASNKPPS